MICDFILEEGNEKNLIYGALLLALAGCSSVQKDVLGTDQSQVQLRSYQSHSFGTTDRERVLRAIISTMQDLGFIIDKADEKLGTVSGTSFAYASKLTVSVRSIGIQILVRANAQADLKQITDPEPYQNFFKALGQSLFLDANEVQ